MTREDIEDQLATLRAELVATEAAIAPVEAVLVPAEARLQAAQAEFDQALQQRTARRAVFVGEWRPRDERAGERALQAIEDAKSLVTAAEEPLQAALVKRNSLQARRSGLILHCRATATRIEQLEAELRLAPAGGPS